MRRLGIKKSTLHVWKAKGWLLPERHFIKIGNVVLYFWSEERLVEIHRLCNQNRAITPGPVRPVPVLKLGDRINWDY